MRGHKLSTTRQLNKHWQSGEVIPDLGDLIINFGNTKVTIKKNNGFDVSLYHGYNYIALPLDYEFNAYGFKFKVRDIIPLIQNYEYQITKSLYFDYGYELLVIKHGQISESTLDIHINDKTLSNEWYIKLPYNYFKIDKTNVTHLYQPSFRDLLWSAVGFYDVHSGILKLNVEKNKMFHWVDHYDLLGVSGEIHLLKDYYYTFMNDFYPSFEHLGYEPTDIFYPGYYNFFYFNKQIGNKFIKTNCHLAVNYNVDLSIYNPEEPIHERDTYTDICRNTTGNKKPYYDFINYKLYDSNIDETYYLCPSMFNVEQNDYKITASEGTYKLESINPHRK